MDDKLPLNGRVRVTCPIVYFGVPNDISGMTEARFVKFYIQVDYIMS